MTTRWNQSNPSIRRILKEAAQMQHEEEASDDQQQPQQQQQQQSQPQQPIWIKAAPLEENLFEWHFTVRGPSDTDYQGGLYHGRIILPPDYPLNPPDIELLTPNGRFQTHTKICLSVTSYHPEHWRPTWGVRTVLLALIGFFPTEGKGAIGALDWPPATCRRLAKESLKWKCSVCAKENCELLPPLPPPSSSVGRSNSSTPSASPSGSDPLAQIKKDPHLARLIDATVNTKLLSPPSPVPVPVPAPPPQSSDSGPLGDVPLSDGPPAPSESPITNNIGTENEQLTLTAVQDTTSSATTPPIEQTVVPPTPDTATCEAKSVSEDRATLRHRHQSSTDQQQQQPQLPNISDTATTPTTTGAAAVQTTDSTVGFLERNSDAISRIINVLIMLVGLLLALIVAQRLRLF